MRELHCADAGLECDGVLQGETDDEVMQQAAGHVAEKHPELTLDDEMQGKVRGLIHDAH